MGRSLSKKGRVNEDMIIPVFISTIKCNNYMKEISTYIIEVHWDMWVLTHEPYLGMTNVTNKCIGERIKVDKRQKEHT